MAEIQDILELGSLQMEEGWKKAGDTPLDDIFASGRRMESMA